MRRVPVVMAAGALLVPVPAMASVESAGACWADRVASARRVALTRPGDVSFAVVDPTGRTWHWRGTRRHRSASLLKTTVLVAYLRQTAVRSRALTAHERTLLAAMIRRSDNAATNTLLGVLPAAALGAAAEVTGQSAFGLRMPLWGTSPTTALDQARLFHRLYRVLPARHRAGAMGWFATIVPQQRWGIAQVTPPGTGIWFKGGWGAGTGRVTGQAARLVTGGRVWSVAVLTEYSPSHAAGVATIERVARTLVAGGPCPG